MTARRFAAGVRTRRSAQSSFAVTARTRTAGRNRPKGACRGDPVHL